MRRVDADGDEELSFQDFFSTLLPYFVFGDFKVKPLASAVAEKENKMKQRNLDRHRSAVNKHLKSYDKS